MRNQASAIRMTVIKFLIVALTAGAVIAYYYYNEQSREKAIHKLEQEFHQVVSPPTPEPPARTPRDYHILQDQGGIPQAEAVRAGLATAAYAYLSALTPVQQGDGVVKAGGIIVREKRYDLCFQFETRPPQEQYIEYVLGGKWERLDFGFGFTDTEPSDPSGKQAIELEFKTDGVVVYTSPQLKPTDVPVFTSIPVAGKNRLMVTCRRIGMQNTLAPVLLDPFLTATETAPAESTPATK